MHAMAQMYTRRKPEAESSSIPRCLVQLRGSEVEPILEKCMEEGYNFIDVSKALETPDLGGMIKKYNDRIKVAAQFEVNGPDSNESTEASQPKSVREQCLDVLRLLSIDKIDFFYQKPRNSGMELSSWVAELKGLVVEGHVGYIGIAAMNPATIREAHAICPIQMVCIAMSPWNPPNENLAVSVCQELGIGILATTVNARGLINLDTGNPRENAANVLSSQKESLLEQVEKAQGLPRKAIANKAKALSRKYPEVLGLSMGKLFSSQDKVFLEKLQSLGGENISEVVADMRTLAESQKTILLTAVQNVVSNHQNNLEKKLDSLTDAADSRVIATIGRVMESLTTKLAGKLGTVRSRQFEVRMTKLSSAFGADSKACKMASRIFERQTSVLSTQILKLRSLQTERLMTALGETQAKKRQESDTSVEKSLMKHFNIIEKKLPRALNKRGRSRMPPGLAKILKHQRDAFEKRHQQESADASQGLARSCKRRLSKQEDVLVKRIDDLVAKEQVKNEKKALSVFSERAFASSDDPEKWDRSDAGRTILEEGIILNKQLQKFADDNSSSPLTVAIAWAQNQGDDITVFSCIQGVKQLESLKLASELSKREEIHALEEHISTYQDHVMSALAWVAVEPEELVVA